MNTTLSQTTQPIKIPIWVILFIAALNGLVYVFLVPPWQHYDEPGNFEYVWLMANLNHKPEIGVYNQEMRREMAASMVEHNFFRGMNGIPNLIAMNEGVWIGIAQLNDPPLYYFIASLPLRLLAHVDITLQLYLTRLVSWGLFLLTILIARFAAEVRRVGKRYYVQTPNRHFWIEPHLLTPLIHFLPKSWQKKLVRPFTL